MTLIFLVILAALVFTYINGFHDSANSIATVVATKVLTPRQAVMLAAITNLVGAFMGTAVATTIASGPGGPESGDIAGADLRVAVRHRLEPVDVVVWPAVELVPRADRRLMRCLSGGRA